MDDDGQCRHTLLLSVSILRIDDSTRFSSWIFTPANAFNMVVLVDLVVDRCSEYNNESGVELPHKFMRDWYSGCAGAFQASEGRSFLPFRSKQKQEQIYEAAEARPREFSFALFPSISIGHGSHVVVIFR